MQMKAWAGPAWDQLTEEQRDRLEAIAEAVGQRYPDVDDQAERDAALSAAVQYMLGETTLAEAGEALAAARRAERERMAAVRQLVIMSCADGLTETAAAEQAGVDRAKTVRPWLAAQ